MTKKLSFLRQCGLAILAVSFALLGCGEQTGTGQAPSQPGANLGSGAPETHTLQTVPFTIPEYRTPPPPTALRDVRQGNIAQIRDIIVAGYTSTEWSQMESDLNAVRSAATNYVNTQGTMPPTLAPEAASLQAIVEAGAPAVANQIMAFLGGPGVVGRIQPQGFAAAGAADTTGGGGPDEDAIDAWSLVHFTSGCLLGEMGFGFGSTLTLLVLWEVVEPYIWPGWHESPENQITDVVVGMLGWWLCTHDNDDL